MPGGGAARRGAMLAMPLLVMNMGGEMVYILEQRLHAQNIPVEKSRKGDARMTFVWQLLSVLTLWFFVLPTSALQS